VVIMPSMAEPKLETGAPSKYPSPRIRLARPDVGQEEADAIAKVLSSGVLTNGPETRMFEEEFAAYHQVDHAVAFANGTLALIAMFAALGIGPGDEVIVPSFTFVSSATSISLVGATPVFADIDPDTFNVDPADVARRVTPKTKAILAVHYAGQAADLVELQAIADDAGAVLLEDAAEAHGATYRGRHVGTWGRAAMFSFTPTKNITTGEGGMVTTGDGDLAGRLRLLRNHGQTALYQHELLGWNMRITEMQAAMGRCQIRKLPSILTRKREHAEFMGAALGPAPGIQVPIVRSDRDHVYMLYTVKLTAGRDGVLDALLTKGVEARVYFPPVHRQPIFAGTWLELPVTDEIAGKVLSLPLHSRLGSSDLDIVAAALLSAMA
jgi:perosamine synthetase